jgi:hypothetical protein
MEKRIHPSTKHIEFDDLQIREAAKLYKIPIIILSSSIKRAFFDFEYEVKREDNYFPRDPLYVWIEKDMFAVLVHKSQ